MPYTVLDPALAEIAPVTDAGAPQVGVGMNFAELKSQITEDLVGRGDIRTRIGNWINRDYRTLCAMLEINELNASVSIPFVSGQPFYLIPDAVSWIKGYGVEDTTDYLDGGREFELIDLQTYRTLPDSASINTTANVLFPFKYFRFARMLVIWPTPTVVLTTALDFRVRPAKLINDEDCPLLPEEYHDVLYDMATATAKRKLGFRAEGDREYNDALGRLRPMINADAHEKDSMHMALAPVRRRSQLYRGRI